MDTMYVDYISGRFEAWTYSDGDKVRFSMHNISEIRKYAEKHGYNIILSDIAKLYV